MFSFWEDVDLHHCSESLCHFDTHAFQRAEDIICPYSMGRRRFCPGLTIYYYCVNTPLKKNPPAEGARTMDHVRILRGKRVCATPLIKTIKSGIGSSSYACQGKYHSSSRAQLPNNMQMTWHEHADWFARDFLQRNFKRNASEKTVNFLFSQTDPIPSPGK